MSTTITGVSQQTTEHVMLQPSETMPQPRVEVCVVQQHSIMEVNLKGKALVAAVLFLILTNLLFHQFWSCIIVAFLPIPFVIYNDYMNFLSLGPGGTPSTFAGYLKITYLRFFALSDPYTPVMFAERLNPPQGYYKGSPSWLPKRSGPRPTIAGIAPHRQVDQPGCPEMYQKLRSSLELLAKKDPENFRTDISCFEKKGLALFANNPINATCRGEICHVHHLEHSMHMNLHPEDAKLVLENGWGERHPLAKGGWLSQYVPREFVMVYAPRDQTELEFVARIIEAAGFWVSGLRISLGTTDDDNA